MVAPRGPRQMTDIVLVNKRMGEETGAGPEKLLADRWSAQVQQDASVHAKQESINLIKEADEQLSTGRK